jgi:sodium-dependent dicarboxylate transporter 2/3/5
MLPATIAGSMAFMLPVATPPNAIIFGTRRVRITQMLKTGLFLNIIGTIVLSLIVYYFGTYIFDIDISTFPEWAKPK